MKRTTFKLFSAQLLTGALVLGGFLSLTGCNPQMPLYLGKHAPLPVDPYLDMATQIEYPNTETETIEEVKGAQAPLTINNSKGKEIVNITLEEAIRCGLYNSTVIRNLGGISYGAQGANGEPTALTTNPSSISTIYNPAITESDGRYGVEAVLADFDTQWSSAINFQETNDMENLASNNYELARLKTKGASFSTQLQKTNATGGTVTARLKTDYIWSNSNSVAVPSYYNTKVEAEFRQPLLRGAGTQFNRIAGPGAIPGFYNGVMIARLRTDISLVDFEQSVRNLAVDIERAYWELYFAYRRLDSVVAGRNKALETWRQAQAKYESGYRGGSAQERAQAQQQYFMFKGSTESALDALYKAEANFRYIIGLTSADGRLFRPADEPSVAKINFDWCEAHTESMNRNIELRRQKWVIKQSELELLASKNFLLPSLDLVGKGSVGGADEHFWNEYGSESSWGQLTHDGMWSGLIGAEFTVPIGFRRERSAVRNAELSLARNRAILQEQELEVTHRLAHAVRSLEDNYVLAQTYFNRRVAAQKEVEATSAAYETGSITLNILLDAQRRLAEAEIDFFRAVIDYNLAIVDIHTQKGSLLEYDGITLSEGPWASKAYFDAQKRAKIREKGRYMNYGFTRPNVISEGAYRQHTGMADPASLKNRLQDEIYNQNLTPAAPENMEVIPAPAPKNQRSILNSAPESTMEVIPTPAPRQITSTGITQTSYIDPTNVAVDPVPGEKSEKVFLKLKK